MKYLFFVHSHISYLSALSVISYKQLDVKDCHILSSSYSSTKPIKVVNINSLAKLNGLYNKVHDWFCPQNLVDRAVNELVGDAPFEFYMAWSYMTCKFFITHKNCANFHFLEEGLSAYWNDMSLKEIMFQHNPKAHSRSVLSFTGLKERIIDSLLVFRGYNSVIQSIPDLYFQFISDNSIHYYGYCEQSFVFAFRNKHIMSMLDTLKQYEFDNVLKLNSKYLYVSDYNHLSHDTIDDYKKELDKLTSYIKRHGIDEIYIKWHYKCEKSTKDILTEYVRSRFPGKVLIIPTEVILEITFIKSERLIVLGNTSSLLFYASLLGHSSYSLCEKRNECFEEYWKRVNLITE